jgi:hypothetical protein
MSKCHNFLAVVRGPSDPTIACGTITTLLKHLELAEKTRRHMSTRRALLFHHSVFLFIVSLSLFLRFHFRVTVQAIRGGWNNTRCPQNLELRWLHASRLPSCGLSFYRSPFSSFSFLFPSIPLFFFSAQVTVRQS